MDINLPLNLFPGFILYALIVILILKPGQALSARTIGSLMCLLAGVALISGLMNWQAMLFLMISTLLALQLNSEQPAFRYTAWLCLFLAPLALALHVIPGFTSTSIFGPATLGLSNIPYELNANIDKGLGALLIIFCFRYLLKAPFKLSYNISLVGKIGFAMLAIFMAAFFLGVPMDPKFGALSLAFIFLNLFVTCVAEEAFFRLLIQRFIFLKTGSPLFAILGSALIFTLAHFHTGPGASERLALIFMAGVLYAWSYQKTGSLVIAILCHFDLNIIHFSFFAYPASFY